MGAEVPRRQTDVLAVVDRTRDRKWSVAGSGKLRAGK